MELNMGAGMLELSPGQEETERGRGSGDGGAGEAAVAFRTVPEQTGS